MAAVALNGECLEAEIQATQSDSDLETLFQIAMQCQIIDDVVDYREDLSAGLPSVLTACGSLPLSIELTAIAARCYGMSREGSSGNAVFPFRIALCVVTAVTKLIVRLAHPLHRSAKLSTSTGVA